MKRKRERKRGKIKRWIDRSQRRERKIVLCLCLHLFP
jgi:hypothetical protein